MPNKQPLGIRVVNTKEFIASAKKYGVKVDRELLQVGRTLMSRIEKQAKRRAPVDTDILRAGITWSIGIAGGRIVGRIGSPARYAKYVEFREKVGNTTVYNPAAVHQVSAPITTWAALRARGGSGQSMPFLRPAIAAVIREQAVALIKKALRRAGR